MAINLQDRLNRGREIINGAGPSKLIVAGIILAAATAVLLTALFYKSDPPYGVLYSQLSPEDAGAIAAELKTQKIPYNLTAEGTAIEVEADRVSAVRVDLAVKGLPSKSNVGFEIFDNQKLGVTDLVQKTNLMRAVTGELERTMMSMPEIDNARVHVSIPKETLFIEDQERPQASVLLTLRRGAALSKAQIMGIVQLMTSSVEGLGANDVSIVDSENGLIWNSELNKPGFLSDDQAKRKAEFENDLRRRIQAMMERVVGFDRVTTTVFAELDFKEVVTQEDIWDPERTAVRSEQKIVEKQLGPARAMAGIPNATYELGTANRQNSGLGGQQEQYSRTEETNNYEVTNTKRQTVSKAGDLKKLSVSVILDGVYALNEAGEKIFTPLPQEMLTQLEESVKSIVGFDASRGDTVAVTSMQFARPDELPVWLPFILELLREFSRPFINLILIVLFFFLVVRPIMNWLKKEVEPAGSGAEPAVLPEYPGGGPGGPGFGDGLPLPAAPRAEEAPALALKASPADEVGEIPERTELEEGPNYDEEEEEVEEEEPPRLAYGNLSRENILPLARENLDRTVGLVRGWIDEKAKTSDEPKM
ncbi:MAG: flagellar M-ring protein FliF [Candidatus Adiutrix sp.]|jgi:flagellar M-ring protein FliF|nr:flagellar M-ring protein FliF [Candidatus Adiutrix sp.]